MIKVVDGHEDEPTQPWRPCTTIDWCRGFDHVSGSLINTDQPHYFDDGGIRNVGFAMIPEMNFSCAMTSDAGSAYVYRGGCDRCTCQECDGWCVWRWRQLAAFVQASAADSALYNELIWSKADWQARLPNSIQAVMCIRDRNDCTDARSTHASLLHAYGLTRERVPLVFYDVSAGFTEIV